MMAERQGRILQFNRPNIKPNDHYLSYNIFHRPGREVFLDSLMGKYKANFDVGVWASVDRDKTAAFAKSFFGKHFRNLLFVSTINREQYEGTQKEYSPEPLPVERDLSQINSKFPAYDLHNIVMVNNFPNKLEQFLCITYQQVVNDIIIPKYELNEDDNSLEVLIKYLNGLSILINKNQVQDIRTAIRAKPMINLSVRMDNLRNKQHEYL